jgi:phosphoglycerate dehydrogenase-like enzyme
MNAETGIRPRPVVVALGPVDPAVVLPVLGDVRLVQNPGPEDLAVAVGAIVRADARVDADLLAAAPRVKVIARTGVGVDLVDLTAATARRIPVVITPGSGTRSVAEGVFALTLHLVKRLGPLTNLVASGEWADRGTVSVGDLDGATIGIVGYGRIGRRVGEIAETFGMRVLAHDPVTPPPVDRNRSDLLDLVAEADILTLHLPLTEQTRNLVDRKLLAAVQPGAVLVNCGRGGLVDLDAVLEALREGRLAGVGLDVFDPEPPPHHELFDHPDVVLTPHLMGMSRRATRATFIDAAQGVADVLAGRLPQAVANPGWNNPQSNYRDKPDQEDQ